MTNMRTMGDLIIQLGSHENELIIIKLVYKNLINRNVRPKI
jgi:hypothetical protein